MRQALVACTTLLLLAGCLSGDEDVEREPVKQTCPVQDASWSHRVDMPNHAGGGPTGQTSSHSVRIDMPADLDWSVRDADCVQAIHITASWTNGPTGGADLFVSVVIPGTETRVLGHDKQQYALDGEHIETVFAPTAMDGFSGAALLAGLDIALHTQWASLSEDGLPVTIAVTMVVP